MAVFSWEMVLNLTQQGSKYHQHAIPCSHPTAMFPRKDYLHTAICASHVTPYILYQYINIDIKVDLPSVNKNVDLYILYQYINIDIKVDLPSVNKNVDLPSVNKTKIFWQKFKNVIKYNISHTPSEVGVLVSIIFPIHQKKPCQVDWQKLVFPVKINSVQEKLSSLMKIKQNEKSTFI